MAKRKRLSPAQEGFLAASPAGKPPLGTPASVGAAPIAQVASDASAQAALQELSGVLETARAKGLMIEELPLAVIDESYLVRDRILQDEDDMQALMTSLSARGQQTPIEVVKLDNPKDGKAYGLISGWRRLEALRRLYKGRPESESPVIKALAVQPETAEAAYVAMVEENEIRVNLSHYERARIALKALEMGLYEDRRKAILGLFGNASRTKRSKIASFAALAEALDPVLKFPAAIPEKLGLALVQKLEEDSSFRDWLQEGLELLQPSTAAEELEVLQLRLGNFSLKETLNKPSEPEAGWEPPAPAAGIPEEMMPRVRLAGDAPASGERAWSSLPGGLKVGYTADQNRIELIGKGVDESLLRALKAWLQRR